MKKEDQVLLLLKEGGSGFVSGEEISKTLKVSRAAVWKEVESLRALGYEIDAHPRQGYRLEQVPDKLFADEISHKLGTKVLGQHIISYEEINSTNDAIFRLGEQGVKEGVCVFAEHQKKGRGRLGRDWNSPKGKNILVSILLRPPMTPSEASRLTLVAAVSVVKTVQKITGIQAGIKWPNDVLFKNKKLCGILTEMNAEADRVNFVVLGIGLNVNSKTSELPEGSTSLKEMAGKEVSRIKTAQELLKQLESDYTDLKKGRFESLAEDWERYSVTSGRRVTATLTGRKIHGQATGIDRDGALWIRTDQGLQEKVTAGDIQYLRG